MMMQMIPQLLLALLMFALLSPVHCRQARQGTGRRTATGLDGGEHGQGLEAGVCIR